MQHQIQQLMAEIDRLYDHPDPHEAVWERAAEVARDAGHRAAYAGFPHLHEASRQFHSMRNGRLAGFSVSAIAPGPR